ncbi:MAG: tRNA epoxyqueuosine(34) reductase QueG, partial [Pseudomonadota bacterium]|nr:tRNA epoxyqueuosine(34) reductase QueG [Pseudomonadota bacterium]
GCGTCTACLTICPTNAIVAPYKVDARRCISYLTIESDKDIPEDLRPMMGNRIYGCDDCQLVCPWNRFADVTSEEDFHPRQVLHGQSLNALFGWSEETFLRNTEGSPIRRIGFEKWQRNIAVALGNAPYDEQSILLLKERRGSVSDLVDRHIDWALKRQQEKQQASDAKNRQQARLIRVIEKGLPRDA